MGIERVYIDDGQWKLIKEKHLVTKANPARFIDLYIFSDMRK